MTVPAQNGQIIGGLRKTQIVAGWMDKGDGCLQSESFVCGVQQNVVCHVL